MAAFKKGRRPGGPGMGAGVDMDDLLAQMFGGGTGMGGMPGMNGARGPRKQKKGADEEKDCEVSLEELYKGKTKRFAVTKNVLCRHCKGRGAKEGAKAKECGSCKGKGKSAPVHDRAKQQLLTRR